MTNEITRIKEYVERRKKSAQTHIDSIHAFDLGPSEGVELRLSDIEALIAKVGSLAADVERSSSIEAALVKAKEALQSHAKQKLGYYPDSALIKEIDGALAKEKV